LVTLASGAFLDHRANFILGGLFLSSLALARKPKAGNTARLLQILVFLRFSAGFYYFVV
jgi:hypothetical protein